MRAILKVFIKILKTDFSSTLAPSTVWEAHSPDLLEPLADLAQKIKIKIQSFNLPVQRCSAIVCIVLETLDALFLPGLLVRPLYLLETVFSE